MYTAVPWSWRDSFGPNTTLQELNDALVILHIPAITLLAIFMVVGVVGNLFVLCIYSRYPPSFFRVFILWLGAIDLIASSIGNPLLIVSMLHPYMFPSQATCQIFRFVHVCLVVSSVFIFMFISVERHRAICNIERVKMNNKRVHTVCFLCCVFGTGVAVPAIFVYGDSTVYTGINNITGTECFINDELGDIFLPKAYFIFQLLLWLLSLLVMVILYVQIGRRLNWHLKFTRVASYRHSSSATKRLNRSADLDTSHDSEVHMTSVKSDVDTFAREITEMLFVVTVVFVLSFLPHLILIVLNSVKANFSRDMSAGGIVVYNIFLRSFAINSMANPVIYLACQHEFRKDCKRLLKTMCSCCKKSR